MSEIQESMDQVRTDFRIKWYRCPIDSEAFRALTERNDSRGLFQALGHLALVSCTGTLAYICFLQQHWILMAIMLFVHGLIYSFIPGLATHELSHGTVFNRRWLNHFFLQLYSLLGWINYHHYKRSHTFHHQFTLHPRGDREVVLPQNPFPSFLNALQMLTFSWSGLYRTLVMNVKLAFLSTFDDEWSNAIFPDSAPEARRAASNWAKIVLAFHALVILVSIYNGWWLLPVVLTFAPFCANFWTVVVGAPMHNGLMDDVPDFRLCCRTIKLDPFSQFIYWQMNFHTEHHMFAAVPCYNLAILSKIIAKDMPKPRGLIEAWVEMWHIVQRQKKEPAYQFSTPLPASQTQASEGFNTELASLGDLAPTDLASTSEVDTDSPYLIWECRICGFLYNEAVGMPEEGLAPGTRWKDIPENWVCPDCGVSKADFDMIEHSPEVTQKNSQANEATNVAAEKVSEQSPIVIIGSGLAGYHVAREFRRYNKTKKVVLISQDGGEFYSKPMLSNALNKKKTTKNLVNKTYQQMAYDLNIEIYPNLEVTSINPKAKTVTTANGNFSYAKLVLGLGADQITLPLMGNGADEVIRVNDLNDYDRFRHKLSTGSRIFILGAGLIGCEFANDLIGHGYTVEIADKAVYPLSSLVSPNIGAELSAALKAQGVIWHMEHTVKEIRKESEGFFVVLDNGKTVLVDLILSAVGLRPRTALVQKAGLEINRGIVTNEYLQTSNPDIYALGDCAETKQQVRPFIASLCHAGDALARTLSGEPTEISFPPMPVIIKTPACPLVCLAPPPGSEGVWKDLTQNEGSRSVFVDEHGMITGLASSGPATTRKDFGTQLLNTPYDAIA